MEELDWWVTCFLLQGRKILQKGAKLVLSSLLLLPREFATFFFNQYYIAFLFGAWKNNLSQSASCRAEKKTELAGRVCIKLGFLP